MFGWSESNSVMAWLAEQPDVQADRIGIMGFCFGGRTSLLYSLHNNQIASTVVLYGTHPKHNSAGPPTQETLEACMSTAVTGLLRCQPANVCAWLAVEFCRQSPAVELVSWGGRVVNTACASGFIEEQTAKHRKAAEPRAESPPPFSPARTMRPESPVMRGLLFPSSPRTPALRYDAYY